MPSEEFQLRVITNLESKNAKKLQTELEQIILTLDILKAKGDITPEEYGDILKGQIAAIEDADKNQRASDDKTAKNKEKNIKKGTKVQKDGFKEVSNNAKMLSISLPLLFGFQQASHAVQSLIDPAMELLGVQQTYNQFLAIKYLPTALKQLDAVLEMGDEWGNQSEAQRTLEGDMLLAAKQMADFITYAAQMATTLGAIGAILPEINLAPLGIGITITGQEMGALAGVVYAVTTGLMLMGTQTGLVQANLSGFGAAVALQGTDALAKFLVQVSEAIGEDGGGLPQFGDDLDTSTGKAFSLTDQVSGLFSGLKEINNKGEDWLVSILGTLTGADPKVIKDQLDVLKRGPWNIPITFTTSILGVASVIWDALKWLVKNSISHIPFFANGGYMPYTGLAYLHAGETVVPAGESLNTGINSSPVFNIQASVSSDYDVRRLADQLSKYWVNDMERVSKARGII